MARDSFIFILLVIDSATLSNSGLINWIDRYPSLDPPRHHHQKLWGCPCSPSAVTEHPQHPHARCVTHLEVSTFPAPSAKPEISPLKSPPIEPTPTAAAFSIMRYARLTPIPSINRTKWPGNPIARADSLTVRIRCWKGCRTSQFFQFDTIRVRLGQTSLEWVCEIEPPKSSTVLAFIATAAES